MLTDGLVQADKGHGFLMSRESFGDFQVRSEFWVSHDANSGVFVRCTNPLDVQPGNAYEVNIFDERPDPAYGTGSVVDVAKVSPMPKAGGRWNEMDVTVVGDAFTVVLNGVTTVDKAHNAAHAHGHIALQYGAGVVKFRKVQVRTL